MVGISVKSGYQQSGKLRSDKRRSAKYNTLSLSLFHSILFFPSFSLCHAMYFRPSTIRYRSTFLDSFLSLSLFSSVCLSVSVSLCLSLSMSTLSLFVFFTSTNKTGPNLNLYQTRKRLLKTLRRSPTNDLKLRIKHLTIVIKGHYTTSRRNKVRQGIRPGNFKSLWSAVSAAKDINNEDLPDVMLKDGEKIEEECKKGRYKTQISP